MTENDDTADTEKVAMIKKWLGREALHSIQTLTTEDKKCAKEVQSYSKPQMKNANHSTKENQFI